MRAVIFIVVLPVLLVAGGCSDDVGAQASSDKPENVLRRKLAAGPLVMSGQFPSQFEGWRQMLVLEERNFYAAGVTLNRAAEAIKIWARWALEKPEKRIPEGEMWIRIFTGGYSSKLFTFSIPRSEFMKVNWKAADLDRGAVFNALRIVLLRRDAVSGVRRWCAGGVAPVFCSRLPAYCSRRAC